MPKQRKYEMGDIVELDDQIYRVGSLSPKSTKRRITPINYDGRIAMRSGRSKNIEEKDLNAQAKPIKAYRP